MEFLIKGDINNPGRYEIEKNSFLKDIINIAGGMKDNVPFKAMQIGGPSGGLATKDMLDLPLDFKLLANYGIRRGDSVICIYDENRCAVGLSFRFMQHTQTDFCGKCVPCREGSKRATENMEKLFKGTISDEEYQMLMDLDEMIPLTAFCALGKGSFNTLNKAMKAFPEEFKAHRETGTCPVCQRGLTREIIQPDDERRAQRKLWIDPALCRGCTRCALNCHAEAITGIVRNPHAIDPEKCVKCYTCIENCSFGAIKEVDING